MARGGTRAGYLEFEAADGEVTDGDAREAVALLQLVLGGERADRLQPPVAEARATTRLSTWATGYPVP